MRRARIKDGAGWSERWGALRRLAFRAVVVAAVWMSLGVGLAVADPGVAPPTRSPFEVDLAVDLPVMAITAVIAGAPVVLMDELSGPHCGPVCDRGSLNPFDRTVVGFRSDGAGVAANVMVGSAIALPFVFNLIDVAVSDTADGWSGWATDVMVLGETALVSNALFQVTKFAVRRPRPYAYEPHVSAAERAQADAAMSFYSGHTANAFAMATAYSYLFMKRHPDSWMVIPNWLGTHLLAAGAGVSQVLAGEHFWTDIMVGAVAGSAVGLLIPHLHLRDGQGSVNGDGLSIHLAPTVGPGVIGVTLSVL